MRVHVLQVEDELCKVFDAVYVMVGRGRDERDTRNGMTGFGYHLIHLEARQLTAFTRLRALCHFNLYFIGIDEVFRRHSEPSGCHLFDGGAHRYAVLCLGEAFGILAALTRIASSAYLVHGECHCLMRFFADGTERHGSRDEPTEDILYRLYLLNGYRVAAETKKVTQEDWYFLSVHQPSELLELCI